MCKYMNIVGEDGGTVVKNVFPFRTKFDHDDPPWVCIHHHTRTKTAPWQYILKIMLVAQICTKKTYLHIARAQWACLVPYSGHSEARQATRMIVQIHFSYTLCQTKPNCIDLWDLNVVGLLVLVTLHTVSRLCTLVPRTHIPNRVPCQQKN